MGYVSVDVDIEDIIWSMSSREKENLLIELIDSLSEKDIKKLLEKINHPDKKTFILEYVTENKSSIEMDFHKNLSDLAKSYLRITKEEEEIIEKIAKKYN